MYLISLSLHVSIVMPAPRLCGGKLRESTLVHKMDTRRRGYDTTVKTKTEQFHDA